MGSCPRRVLRRDGEGVSAVGLLDTLIVHAVPLERVDAGRGRKVAGVHDLAGFVTDIKTRCQRILRQEVGGLGDAVLELRLIAIRLDHLSDILNGAERHRVLLQRYKAFEVLVLLHLLFDAGERTSWLVNSCVSSGDNGSWNWSCVVKMVKLSRLLDKSASAWLDAPATALVLVEAAATTCLTPLR